MSNEEDKIANAILKLIDIQTCQLVSLKQYDPDTRKNVKKKIRDKCSPNAKILVVDRIFLDFDMKNEYSAFSALTRLRQRDIKISTQEMKERYSQLKEEEKLFWHLITDKFNSSNILRKLENLLENPPFTVDISSVNEFSPSQIIDKKKKNSLDSEKILENMSDSKSYSENNSEDKNEEKIVIKKSQNQDKSKKEKIKKIEEGVQGNDDVYNCNFRRKRHEEDYYNNSHYTEIDERLKKTKDKKKEKK